MDRPTRRHGSGLAWVQAWRGAALVVGFGIIAPTATAQNNPSMNPPSAPTTATDQVAKGSFTVQMKPQGEADAQAGVSLGRLSLDKVFEGDLTGTGQGQMLTAMTARPGSAGYVAIERVQGTLHGRQGTFVMQHSGTMTQGAQQLAIRIVPDSGTGALVGISGVFHLRLDGGQHRYELAYSLPAAGSPPPGR